MEHLIILLLFPFLVAIQPITSRTDMMKSYTDFESPLTFEETVAVLQKILSSERIAAFATIGYHKTAEIVGESMLPAIMLIADNPEVETVLVQEDPRFAIELPLKILIYERNKTAEIRYERATAMSEKYRIKQTSNIAERIDAIVLQPIKSSVGEWKIIIFAALLRDDKIVTHEHWVVRGLITATPT